MKLYKRLFSIISCIALLVTFAACGETQAPQPSATPKEYAPVISETPAFSIKFFDVGQGDAALVECNGHYMLVDGGKKSDSRLMYTVLKEAEIEKLDYIFATSAAEDHIGGLAGALNYAAADMTFCAVDEYSTEEFEDFKKYADKNGGSIEIPMENSFYRLGDADIEIIAVDKDAANLVIKIIYGNTSVLFTGDMTSEMEAQLIKSDAAVTSTVLKAANYGGSQSSSADFLRRVAPEYAVSLWARKTTKDILTKTCLHCWILHR